MKMETPVKAPYAGRVREILVGVNSQVDGGGALLRIDRIDDGAAASTTPTVEFASTGDRSRRTPRCRRWPTWPRMRALVMGYDVSAARGPRAAVPTTTGFATRPRSTTRTCSAPSLGVLATFADICELSRNRPAGEEESGDERVHSPREYFHAYLHSLDLEREGLPEAFRSRLAAVLAHYGVTDLEPGPELEEAVYRVFLAQERAADQIPIVTGLLERWRNAVPGSPSEMRKRPPARSSSGWWWPPGLRYPVVGDLARSIRYEAYERPLIERTRDDVYADVRGNSAAGREPGRGRSRAERKASRPWSPARSR